MYKKNNTCLNKYGTKSRITIFHDPYYIYLDNHLNNDYFDIPVESFGEFKKIINSIKINQSAGKTE